MLVKDLHFLNLPAGEFRHQPGQAEVLVESLQEEGLDADLHDAGLIDPANPHVLEDPVIDFTFSRFLHNGSCFLFNQTIEDMCLWLRLRVVEETKVTDVGSGEIGQSLLVGGEDLDPKPIRCLRQRLLNTFRRHPGFLAECHEVRSQRRLHLHLLGNFFLHQTRHVFGKGSGPGKQIGDLIPSHTGLLEHGLATGNRLQGCGHDHRSQHQQHCGQSDLGAERHALGISGVTDLGTERGLGKPSPTGESPPLHHPKKPTARWRPRARSAGGERDRCPQRPREMFRLEA